MEVAADGGLLELEVVLAAGGKEALGGVEGEPAAERDVAGVAVRRAQGEVFAAVARDDHGVGIGGGDGLVHDDAGGGALGGGDLVLVHPAAVVGHGFAAEDLRVELAGLGIEDRRIVDEHDDGLAAHVHALVVVPVVLGGDDAIADEHDVAVLLLDMFHDAGGEADEVVDVRERHRFAADGERKRGGGRDAHERHVLNVGAVGIAGLQAHFFELADEVGDGLFLAGRRGTAALKFVRGEDLCAGEHAVRGGCSGADFRESQRRGADGGEQEELSFHGGKHLGRTVSKARPDASPEPAGS